MQLDPSQERAVELACTSAFGIITGGPGTGKSTCLRVALDRIQANGETFALAAPTGKAARRMFEATGRPASTVHRLLGWQRGGWAHTARNPLEEDVVIVDEASMLDVELAADLVSAIRPGGRIILVGDANQLPSVGPGRVLADLVESDAVPIARLTHVHRAAAESWVCRNAPKVLAGAALELTPDCHDFRFYEVENADDAARKVQEIVSLPEFRDAQILSPQRTTAIGVQDLNTVLQKQLNPFRGEANQWTVGERVLRLGDRVIQTVNNYDLAVMNGEVGVISSLDAKQLVVDVGDRAIIFPRSEVTNLHLAYALTVHKCQGSEFQWAICIVHSAHTYMLTRQLFYTAITRAKVGVVLVGNRKGIEVATSAKLPPVRNTGLVARMKKLEEERGAA